MDDAAAPGGGSKSRTAYTRAEIQALMASPSAEAQARLWAQVYAALAAAGFAGEYDGLLAVEESPNRRGNKGKKAAGGRGGRKGPEEAVAPRSLDVVDYGAWRNGDLGVRDEHRLEAAHEPAGVCGEIQEPFDDGEHVDFEDDDSDDEYGGILKPAFAVDGEPDFESGEPLDGFEYLRRVSEFLDVQPGDEDAPPSNNGNPHPFEDNDQFMNIDQPQPPHQQQQLPEVWPAWDQAAQGAAAGAGNAVLAAPDHDMDQQSGISSASVHNMIIKGPGQPMEVEFRMPDLNIPAQHAVPPQLFFPLPQVQDLQPVQIPAPAAQQEEQQQQAPMQQEQEIPIHQLLPQEHPAFQWPDSIPAAAEQEHQHKRTTVAAAEQEQQQDSSQGSAHVNASELNPSQGPQEKDNDQHSAMTIEQEFRNIIQQAIRKHEMAMANRQANTQVITDMVEDQANTQVITDTAEEQPQESKQNKNQQDQAILANRNILKDRVYCRKRFSMFKFVHNRILEFTYIRKNKGKRAKVDTPVTTEGLRRSNRIKELNAGMSGASSSANKPKSSTQQEGLEKVSTLAGITPSSSGSLFLGPFKFPSIKEIDEHLTNFREIPVQAIQEVAVEKCGLSPGEVAIELLMLEREKEKEPAPEQGTSAPAQEADVINV